MRPAPRQPSPPRLGWPDAAALAALLLLALAFFWKMVFTELILPRGDTFTYFYPYWAARSAALQAGRVPLWNPDLFMGAPFLANSQAGVLYPPNWVLSWLDTPTAVKAAAAGHVAWAAMGTYLFGRRSLHLSVLGAVLSGAVFALGGYFTAQVEHINQLQGLAWLPWLFWLWGEAVGGQPRFAVPLGVAFAMQLLAGHSQSAFISGVGLGGWAVWHTAGLWQRGERRWQPLAWPLGAMVVAVALAAGLAAPQLLPTFELTTLSNRSGGLPFSEATSFSLHPLLVGRALLPGYADIALFSEYTAYIGVAGLVLSVAGLTRARRSWRVLGLAALACVGLLFALGAFNPAYWALVLAAPGFGLFRAPARWLVLYTLGMSGLAGVGFDTIVAGQLTRRRPVLIAGALVVVVFGGLSFLAPLAGETVQGATLPAPGELLGWAAALLLALGAVSWLSRRSVARHALPPLLAALVVVELFLAGQSLSYNNLSAPEAWHSQRPSISALLAATAGQQPPARFLSLSDIFFDPGDLRELEVAYGPYLDDDALYDLIIATKLKEIISPNLSMAWGLPSMDGFDGGVLPTRDTIRFTSLFLDDEVAVDGRLREYLDRVPPLEWLRLANVRYIITDKVADAWIDDVYYDLTFPASRPPGDRQPIEARPAQPFTANAAGIVGSSAGAANSPSGTQMARVAVYAEGEDEPLVQPLVLGEGLPAGGERGHILIEWPEALSVERVEITAAPDFPGTLTVDGVSLVDTRSGAFLSTTLSRGGALHLMHSGDVKIYEYLDTLPRAYLVCGPELVESVDAAFERLAEDPSAQTVVDEQPAPVTASCDPAAPGSAAIIRYAPEVVEVRIDASGEGNYLILTDQWYPDWQVNLDGQATESPLRANGLFRAVPVPGGHHTVTFTYRSRLLLIGLGVSAVAIVIAMLALLLWPDASRPVTKPDQRAA